MYRPGLSQHTPFIQEYFGNKDEPEIILHMVKKKNIYYIYIYIYMYEYIYIILRS